MHTLALVVFTLFCFQFIIQIVNTVLTACHAISKVSAINVLGQAVALIVMYFLSAYTKGSLLYLVYTLAGVPLTVQLILSIWYYQNGYKEYAPNIRLIDFKYAKQLIGMGGLFFFIQIGGPRVIPNR